MNQMFLYFTYRRRYLFIYWAIKYHERNKFISKDSIMYVRIIVNALICL